MRKGSNGPYSCQYTPHDDIDHTLQGSHEIPSKQIGYVLRILGQNPTEDDIVEMVMKVLPDI